MDIFKGRKIVIATMHGKEKVIAPLLEKELGVEIIVPKNFNSDQFGTFTRDIKRVGSQLEAARAKVYKAMRIADVDLGISSEGSFGEHPSVAFVQSNIELLLFVDIKNGYEILGHHRTLKINMDRRYVSSVEEAMDFANKIGFPETGIIVRKSEHELTDIYKEIKTQEDFVKKVNKILSLPFTKKVFLETDMRAHRNPTRMKAIKNATLDLLKNITAMCPKCGAPGFVVVDFEKGLKCSLCGVPTELPIKDIYQCSKCDYQEKS